MSVVESDPRFAVDRMVVKLGKYLRILGYDAIWDLDVRAQEWMARARAEDRVFLTRNRHLPDQGLPPPRLVILKETDPVRQLAVVVETFHLNARARLFSACIRCNVRLEPVADRDTVRAHVHPNVFIRYSEFFVCPRCRTVFWKGSHVRNTCRKLGL